MMENMCLRAGIDLPFTNHCVRSTTVNILSSKDMKNRHIRAVTGHKGDASLESYNDRPTFEQFKRQLRRQGKNQGTTNSCKALIKLEYN